MPTRNALIEALTGAPVTQASRFAAVGLDPEGLAPIRRRVAVAKAKKEAKEEGSSPSLGEKFGTGIAQGAKAIQSGNPVYATAAFAEPFVRDPNNDPDVLRSIRATHPTGASAEYRGAQREQLRGEETPFLTERTLGVMPYAPGYQPMLSDSGAVDPLRVGINAATLAALMLGMPATPGPGYFGSQVAARAVPEVLPEKVQQNPYAMAGVQTALASAGGAIDAPSPPAFDFGPVRDILQAPGSFVPSLGTSLPAKFGNEVIQALPTVLGTSRDVMGTLASQRRSRFRRLMLGAQATPSAGVSDPFGLIPDIESTL